MADRINAMLLPGPLPLVPYPLLDFMKLPIAERNQAVFVQELLIDMGRHCADFEGALELLDYCLKPISYTFIALCGEACAADETRRKESWSNIAANAASSTVYLFNEGIKCIGKNLSACNTLSSLIDKKKKREATKKFHKYFPGFEGVRNSRQHRAELYGTPEKLFENAPMTFDHLSALAGRTIRSHFKRNLVQLDISAETLTNLKDVRDTYWAAFLPISKR